MEWLASVAFCLSEGFIRRGREGKATALRYLITAMRIGRANNTAGKKLM